MVDADDVAKVQCLPHALDPPVVPGLLQSLPVIERIAPALAGLAECIGRNAGDDRGTEVRIQEKQLRVRPYVSAVIADEDRDVADDLNTVHSRCRADRAPLLSKEELDDAVKLQLLLKLLSRFCD